MAKRKPDPSIRAAVLTRAAAMGLTARALAIQTDGAVSDDMVRLYIAGKSDLTSRKLDAVFRVLGLQVADVIAR